MQIQYKAPRNWLQTLLQTEIAQGMVTAGVFMLARCNALFALSSTALAVITVVGAVTTLFAATIALTQTDIKRVVAYSTISQLAYMHVTVEHLVADTQQAFAVFAAN